MKGLFDRSKLIDELSEKLREAEAMYDAKVEELEAMTQERNMHNHNEKYLRGVLIELVGKKIAGNHGPSPRLIVGGK